MSDKEKKPVKDEELDKVSGGVMRTNPSVPRTPHDPGGPNPPRPVGPPHKIEPL